MGESMRMVQVIYGFLEEKVSRRVAERFVRAHAAGQGIYVPEPPIARYWCRPAPEGAPHRWMVGWTGPAPAPRPPEPPPPAASNLVVMQ